MHAHTHRLHYNRPNELVQTFKYRNKQQSLLYCKQHLQRQLTILVIFESRVVGDNVDQLLPDAFKQRLKSHLTDPAVTYSRPSLCRRRITRVAFL